MIGGSRGTPWSRWVGAVSDALPGGHLSLDAVVAHVDGELPPGPAARAAAHVDRCPSCAGEVMAQRQARRRLRGADTPGVPASLLSSLRAIPDVAELPEAPAGLTLDAEGRFAVPADVRGTAEPAEPAEPAQPAEHGRGRRAAGSRGRRLPVVVASGLVAGAAAVVGPVVAAGAVPAAVTPGAPTPGAAASLTAAVPVPPAGGRGNPVAASAEHAGPAGAVPAVARPPAPPTPSTTTPTSPPA